jgi:hypothetical protein
LLDLEPVRPFPPADDLADRVGQRDDLLDAGGHGLDALRVERQAIPEGGGEIDGLIEIAPVGFEKAGRGRAQSGRGRPEGGVLPGRRRLGEPAGGGARGAAELANGVFDRQGGVHRTTRSSRWITSSEIL